MKRLLSIFVLTFLYVNLVTTGLAAQESQTGKKELILTRLVGENCTVHLNNGEEISGTFWDYSDDTITVKVKKGLLYSKAEQFSISEIKQFEGPSGEKYNLQALMGVNPDAAKNAETTETPNNETILRILSIKDEPAEESKEEKSREEPVQETTEKQPKPNPAPASTPRTVATSSAVEDQTPPKQPVVSKPTKPSRENAASKVAEKRKIKNLTPVPENPKLPAEIPTQPDRAVKTLRYQTLVLSIAAGVMFVLFVIFKGFGLNSLILAKYSMFPTRLIRMNGPYGIIDQGKEDGVKMDDIVRLYRKNEGKIEYKGKVRVTKVAQNYSAVETIRTKKDIKLGAGDVGIRDRNVLLQVLKLIRTALSTALGSVARILAITARTVSVDHRDPLLEGKTRNVESEHESDIKEVTELVKKSKASENDDETVDASEVSSPK